MSKVKDVSVVRIKELEDRADALTRELDTIEDIQEELKTTLWQKIEEKALNACSEIDDKLFNFEKISDREILILLSRKKEIVNIMSVREYVKMRPKFESDLSEIRRKLRELRTESGPSRVIE